MSNYSIETANRYDYEIANSLEIHDQNSVFLEIVTPIYLQKTGNTGNDNLSTSVLERRTACTLCWKSFPSVYSSLDTEEKRSSVVHRVYWLGETYGINGKVDPQKLSDFLCESFAERIRRWNANVGMNDLIPFDEWVALHKPYLYERGQSYRAWMNEFKGNAKYDIPLIKSFLNKEAISAITDTAFGFTTPVLTNEEIEKIYSLLKENMEPTLEARDIDWRQRSQEKTSSDIEKLTQSINQLVSVITVDKTKGK